MAKMLMTFMLLCILDDGKLYADSVNPISIQSQFDSFLKQYEKQYFGEEYSRRLDIFEQNFLIVKQRNDAELISGGSAVHGINIFSDLSQSEFENTYLAKTDDELLLRTTSKVNNKEELVVSKRTQDIVGAVMPKDYSNFVDWRASYVTPVKNQQRCGACYAFSAVEQIESDTLRLLQNDGFTPENTVLSVQQTFDCFSEGQGIVTYLITCSGGTPESVYFYAEMYGLSTEASYPWVSGTTLHANTCKRNASNSIVGITNYHAINGNEEMMKDYVLSTGPLAVVVDASTWGSYTGGVMTTGCTGIVNHAVQIVGIDLRDPANPYWIVRNQWGTGWGMNGYVYIRYGVGLCSINFHATYTDPLAYRGSPTAAPSVALFDTPSTLPTIANTPVSQVPSTPSTSPSAGVYVGMPVLSPARSRSPTYKIPPAWIPRSPQPTTPTINPSKVPRNCMGVRYIRFDASNSTLQISQVAVYDSRGLNVAKFQPTSSSPPAVGDDCGFYYSSGAVDGILRTKTACDQGMFYQSQSAQGAYWEVNLGADYDIFQIVYYNTRAASIAKATTDYQIRALSSVANATVCEWHIDSTDRVQVFSGNNAVFMGPSQAPTMEPSLLSTTVSPSAPTPLPSVRPTPPTEGGLCPGVRYLNVYAASTPLFISQIEVIDSHGVNVAFNKTATASQVAFNYFAKCKVNPSIAGPLDGVLRMKYDCAGNSNQCTCGAPNQNLQDSFYKGQHKSDQFWEVDLGASYDVIGILYYNQANGVCLDPIKHMYYQNDNVNMTNGEYQQCGIGKNSKGYVYTAYNVDRDPICAWISTSQDPVQVYLPKNAARGTNRPSSAPVSSVPTPTANYMCENARFIRMSKNGGFAVSQIAAYDIAGQNNCKNKKVNASTPYTPTFALDMLFNADGAIDGTMRTKAFGEWDYPYLSRSFYYRTLDYDDTFLEVDMEGDFNITRLVYYNLNASIFDPSLILQAIGILIQVLDSSRQLVCRWTVPTSGAIQTFLPGNAVRTGPPSIAPSFAPTTMATESPTVESTRLSQCSGGTYQTGTTNDWGPNLVVNPNAQNGFTGWTTNSWSYPGQPAGYKVDPVCGCFITSNASQLSSAMTQTIDLYHNLGVNYTQAFMATKPMIYVSEEVSVDGPAPYFVIFSLYDSSMVGISSRSRPSSTLTAGSKFQFTFSTFMGPVRYIKITHGGSMGNKPYPGAYGTKISQTTVKIFGPSSVCSPCSNGTYSSAGAYACVKCPSNTNSLPGSSTCQPGVPNITNTTEPSTAPTITQIFSPSSLPTAALSSSPTVSPNFSPSRCPSSGPSSGSVVPPSLRPSALPTKVTPFSSPSINPTVAPSNSPILVPSALLTAVPSSSPSSYPNIVPSRSPSSGPASRLPSTIPTVTSTRSPSVNPRTSPSGNPSSGPASAPSLLSSASPSSKTTPSGSPSKFPSSTASSVPTISPRMNPSFSSTAKPSVSKTDSPTTLRPSRHPTVSPTFSSSVLPTYRPSVVPSIIRTIPPTCSSSVGMPSRYPTLTVPHGIPSTVPSKNPSTAPSTGPSKRPTLKPSLLPSCNPTKSPTRRPSPKPSSGLSTGTSLSTKPPSPSPKKTVVTINAVNTRSQPHR